MDSPARAAVRPRSSWLLVALAAAWVMFSLAIGSAIQPNAADAGQPQAVTDSAQP